MRHVHLLILGLFLCSASWADVPKAQFSTEELSARIEKAGDDPLSLLALVPHADDEKAGELRQKVNKLLAQKIPTLSPAQLHSLGQEVAEALQNTVTTQEEVGDVLGKAKKVSRQVLFRRSVEQWRYEQPLPLVVTFHFQKGQPPRLTSVQVWKTAKL